MSEDLHDYIKNVWIEDVKCFKGKHYFSFADEHGAWRRWTVFLGDNNTGKTNLLKEIATLSGNSHESRPDMSNIQGALPTPGPRLLCGYGVVRNIEKKGIPTEADEMATANNLFYQSNLINFEDWLFQLDYAAKNKNEEAAGRRDLLEKVITSELLPEISNIRFTTDEKLNNYIQYKTKDGWRRLAELGYGYQATLSWMMDFCKNLFDRYPTSANPLKEPAVLLVDEIDLHLHPQWQRTIIKYLSGIFTHTQFIVTTHSPFVIQSMEKVNLYTLRREGDHTNVQHLGCRSFVGWRIEEILSEIMGLEDNIQTDIYQSLTKQFDEAIDAGNYPQGKAAYDKLMEILHPQSVERKLLDIQFSRLLPDDKD
jgi:predicted ATP-binding protein involved in virulence